jgi:DNA (cytosine-5)-methyltransferase 1
MWPGITAGCDARCSCTWAMRGGVYQVKYRNAMRGPTRRPAMARPLLLDLFCGAGGAAVGYHRAGFEVIGADIKPQPHYPFEFLQADALELLRELALDHPIVVYLRDEIFPIDAIHASPPCQRYIQSGMFDRSKHPDLLPAVRSLLVATGRPWVIENVPGAPMRVDLEICGCSIGLPELKRKRLFETSWRAFDLRQPCHHPDPPVGVYGHPRGGQPGETWGWGTFEDWKRATGIDWMTAEELKLAIPPAYTEYIGAQLLEHLAAVAP